MLSHWPKISVRNGNNLLSCISSENIHLIVPKLRDYLPAIDKEQVSCLYGQKRGSVVRICRASHGLYRHVFLTTNPGKNWNQIFLNKCVRASNAFIALCCCLKGTIHLTSCKRHTGGHVSPLKQIMFIYTQCNSLSYGSGLYDTRVKRLHHEPNMSLYVVISVHTKHFM